MLLLFLRDRRLQSLQTRTSSPSLSTSSPSLSPFPSSHIPTNTTPTLQHTRRQTTTTTTPTDRRHARGAERKGSTGPSKMAVPPARGASGIDPLRLIITGLRTMLLLLSLWELALSNFFPLPPRLPTSASSSSASALGTVSEWSGCCVGASWVAEARQGGGKAKEARAGVIPSVGFPPAPPSVRE